MKTDIQLTEDEARQLQERGYEILERLGEGQQREAYLVRYQSGKVSKTRVLTISKPEVKPDSVCSVITRCKGRNLDEVEVDISNQIQHVNVVEVVDKTFTQSRESNIIWNYNVSLKAVAPINNSVRSRSSLISILTANALQKSINTLASNINSSLPIIA